MAFMFNTLDENEKKMITEGDEGDCLYVVGSGTLMCQKVLKGNTEPTFLKTY
jgi:hypothetical protein